MSWRSDPEINRTYRGSEADRCHQAPPGRHVIGCPRSSAGCRWDRWWECVERACPCAMIQQALVTCMWRCMWGMPKQSQTEPLPLSSTVNGVYSFLIPFWLLRQGCPFGSFWYGILWLLVQLLFDLLPIQTLTHLSPVHVRVLLLEVSVEFPKTLTAAQKDTWSWDVSEEIHLIKST